MTELQGAYVAHLRVIRCVDGAIVNVRQAKRDDWDALQAAVGEHVRQLALTLPDTPPAKPALTEACEEEASIFHGIADSLAFSRTRDPWTQYQAARSFQVAAMLAQDTRGECKAIHRMPVCAIDHPLVYDYHENWQNHQLPAAAETHNRWLLEQIETMAQHASDCDGHDTLDPGSEWESAATALLSSQTDLNQEALLEALDKAGDWESAYALLHQLIPVSDFTETDRRAARRLRICSLSGRPQEADAFLEQLQGSDARAEFTLIQAALHYRRNDQPAHEWTVMKERLETGQWRTFSPGFLRLCALLERFETPENCLRLLDLLPTKFHQHAILGLQYRSHQALGHEAEAKASPPCCSRATTSAVAATEACSASNSTCGSKSAQPRNGHCRADSSDSATV